jgi:tRNA threonylcarbamoyladenosine dehydratase
MDFTERTQLLIGASKANALASARVCILGIGGVGSNCAISLARAGIGSFLLVDYDTVSVSNINRQALAFHSTVGQKKTNVLCRMILDINPNSQVDIWEKQILPSDIAVLLEKAGNVAAVIDTADLVTVKVALALECEKQGISYIAGIGSGNKLDPLQIQPADIYETYNCRMCKAVRKEARKQGLASMRVYYSPEEPLVIQANEDARKARSNIGTISYYPAVMGHLIAADVIRSLIAKQD